MKVEDLGHILNQIPDPSTRKAVARLWMNGQFNEVRADTLRSNGFGVDEYVVIEGDSIEARGAGNNVDLNIRAKGSGSVNLFSPAISGGTASFASIGATLATVQHQTFITSDPAGKIQIKSAEASVEPEAATSAVIETKVPSGSLILGCSLRVDAEVSDAFNAAFSGGNTESIDAAVAVTKNTKVNKLLNADNTTSGETNITLQVNSNPGTATFTAQGKVSAIVYYLQLTPMADIPD